MGCAGGKDRQEALNKIQENIAKAPGGGPRGDEGLQELAVCASELREVFQAIVAAGATDSAGMNRIGLLSENVLTNLERRITVDLLRRADAKSVIGKIQRVATDLDAVRATKATTIIEDVAKRRRGEIQQEEEQKAKKDLEQLRHILDRIQEPKDVVNGSKAALDIIEQVHAKVPTNKKILDMLMKAVVQLATKIIGFQVGWAPNPANAAIVRDIAVRIDAVAEKLVKVLGAAWDPPMVPQVERLIHDFALRRCKELVGATHLAIADRKCGLALDSLQSLLQVWPSLKDMEAVSLQIVALFSKVQTFATEEFKAATKAGISGTAEQIKSFAQKLDALRSKYEGLPEGPSLVDALASGEASVIAEKSLKLFEAEVAKISGDSPTRGLSLAGTVQAIEALVPIWPAAVEAEPALAERLAAGCAAVEAWTEEMAQRCGPAKIGSLAKFAEEYDTRRPKLVPPPVAEPLHPRVASIAASVHLSTVKAELAKEKGLNPVILLDELKACANMTPVGEAGNSLRQQLATEVTNTMQRVLMSFREAMTGGEARKEQSLMQFAKKFDEALQGFSGDAEVNLEAQLEEEQRKASEQQFKELEQSIQATDLQAILQALGALQPSWPQLPEDRARACLAKVQECLLKAVVGQGPEAANSIVQLAEDMDGTLVGLSAEAVGAGLLAPVASAAAKEHVLAVGALLKKTDLSELDLSTGGPIAQGLEAARRIFKNAGPDEDLKGQANETLEPRCGEVLMGALAAGTGTARPEELVELAASADSLLGPRPEASLRSRLEAAQPAASKLAEVRAMLAKSSGMNPVQLIQILRELVPLWPPVGTEVAFRDSLTKELEQFREKLVEAAKKAQAAEADVAKKTSAVATLAGEADKAQSDLAKGASGAGSFEARLFRGSVLVALVANGLEVAEAEVAKDTGLNPNLLLKGVKEAAPIWAAAAAADTSLEKRAQELLERVRMRMGESMQEAKASGNAGKQQALLKFATEFDAACSGWGGGSNLKQQLEQIAAS